MWWQVWFYSLMLEEEEIWREEWLRSNEVGQGHSVEYRADVALVAFNPLHLRGLGQSCSSSQILFVLNLTRTRNQSINEWLASPSANLLILHLWEHTSTKAHRMRQTSIQTFNKERTHFRCWLQNNWNEKVTDHIGFQTQVHVGDA